MPKQKKSELNEIQELKVLLVGLRSQQTLILERVEGLPERLEHVEFRLGRVEQDTSGTHAALISHSTEIQRLQHDVQKLQHEIAKLIERSDLHQKEHAT